MEIRTLEKLNARKNQRVIITLLGEEIETVDSRQKITTAGYLEIYTNTNLISMEEGAWERTVRDVKENSWYKLW